jgi:hypothetical protein
MISACGGVFVWLEFARAPFPSKALLAWMFLFSLFRLTAIAVAPLLL